MADHEYTFGDTHCLIAVQGRPILTGGAVYIATPFLVLDEGRELQGIGDKEGKQLELPAGAEVDAVERASRYLEERFGIRADAPRSKRPISHRVELKPPLRDER
jgi:hypothetical protein